MPYVVATASVRIGDGPEAITFSSRAFNLPSFPPVGMTLDLVQFVSRITDTHFDTEADVLRIELEGFSWEDTRYRPEDRKALIEKLSHSGWAVLTEPDRMKKHAAHVGATYVGNFRPRGFTPSHAVA